MSEVIEISKLMSLRSCQINYISFFHNFQIINEIYGFIRNFIEFWHSDHKHLPAIFHSQLRPLKPQIYTLHSFKLVQGVAIFATYTHFPHPYFGVKTRGMWAIWCLPVTASPPCSSDPDANKK